MVLWLASTCVAFGCVFQARSGQIVFKDQRVQKVAYVLERKIWMGPVLANHVRLEYDHGRFRETTLTRDGRAAQVSVYNGNPQRLSYVYIPLAPGKQATLSLESYTGRLAITDPQKYREMHRLPTGDIFLSGPICHVLQEYQPTSDAREVGRARVADRPCIVYEIKAGAETVRKKVWNKSVLEEEWVESGRIARVTSLKMVDSLPPSNFELPHGYKVSESGSASADRVHGSRAEKGGALGDQAAPAGRHP